MQSFIENLKKINKLIKKQRGRFFAEYQSTLFQNDFLLKVLKLSKLVKYFWQKCGRKIQNLLETARMMVSQ